MCQGSLSCIRAFPGIVFFLFVCYLVFLVIPWFGLLSHVSSLRLSSGHSSPVLTLKTDDAVRASLSSTHSLMVKASVWATSLLAVVVRRIFCSCFLFVCLFLFVSPGYVTRWDSKTLHRPACERASYCVGTSPLSRLPSQEGSPPLNVLSLFLPFILCPTSFQKEWSAFLGAWCPPPAFRICFVEVAQYSNDLLMNLWGRKWSPHPIPPPSLDCLLKLSFKKGVQEYSIGKRKSLHCIGKTGYPYKKEWNWTSALVWMSVPPKLISWIPTVQYDSFPKWNMCRWLDHEGSAIVNEINIFTKEECQWRCTKFGTLVPWRWYINWYNHYGN